MAMLKKLKNLVAFLAERIKEDFTTLESQMSQVINIIYVDKYESYECKRCGCSSNLELCDTCDY
jgi:hypothetical protein